jgi:septal ring factor EnvC (AmiA/AmiB activator)
MIKHITSTIEGTRMTAAEIVAILTGLGGLIVGIIAALSGARKDEMSLLQTTLEGLTKENERIRKRLAELQTCVDASEATIDKLKDQIDEWKHKYDNLNQDWLTKYTKLQYEFDQFKLQQSLGGPGK